MNMHDLAKGVESSFGISTGLDQKGMVSDEKEALKSLLVLQIPQLMYNIY